MGGGAQEKEGRLSKDTDLHTREQAPRGNGQPRRQQVNPSRYLFLTMKTQFDSKEERKKKFCVA